ncbi:MAG: hypothetical protein ACLR3C_00280 [Eggerthella lenta]
MRRHADKLEVVKLAVGTRGRAAGASARVRRAPPRGGRRAPG